MMNCDRCKRQLEGTVHTKDSYRIDLFRLWTGNAVPVVFKEEGEEEMKFFRIEEPALITLCKECFAAPEVKDALKRFESPL